jgi:hypothetical protein
VLAVAAPVRIYEKGDISTFAVGELKNRALRCLAVGEIGEGNKAWFHR